MDTKHRFIIPAILTTALTLTNLSAQSTSDKPEKILHKITVEELEVETKKTPRFSFNGPRISKLPDNKKWLEIEAKLNIETKSKLAFLPALKATFHVVTKEKNKFIRTEKTITFKNINIEDGEAWICAYIDPDTLRVITTKKNPKVKDLTGIAITIDGANLYKGKNQKYLPFAQEIFDRSIISKRKNSKNKKSRWWKDIPNPSLTSYKY